VFLAVGALVFPASLWSGFFDALGVYRADAIAHGFNRSFDAVLRAAVLPDLEAGPLTALSLALRVAGLGYVWARWVRRLGPDVEWTFVLLAAVVLNDYVWPHYFVLLIPHAAMLVRAGKAPMWLLPLAGGVGSLLVATWSRPVLSGVLCQVVAIGAVAVLPVLAGRAQASSAAAPEAPSTPQPAGT
jgi:hypothetical protein